MSAGACLQPSGSQEPRADARMLYAPGATPAIDPSVFFGLLGQLPDVGAWPWPAGGLDPVATARGSLAGLSGCASMTFGLIVNTLKEALRESIWQAIGRRQLKRAFNGGASATDCGGIHGSIVMMTLVGAPPAVQHEFCRWYCSFAFPSTEWDDLYPIKNTVQTVSCSPLCQQSRTVWELAFTRDVYPVTGVYDTTRCSKVPRDCAKKAVELINGFKSGAGRGAWPSETH